ncbi:MAG: radical SAM protein [Candidatus Omnitrophica bacterium]|nr:radical SAM protein [Candidatus Omnitrophota bacterium]
MTIAGPVIRPPSEAGSFLLQVTLGCSANQCSFCGAYTGKTFGIKPREEVLEDIRKQKEEDAGVRRVFLLDGDALAVRNNGLIPVLRELDKAFPALTRVASYANGFNITLRSREELKELRENKLSLIYIGLESGSQKVLNACGKRSGVDEMVEAVGKAEEAGIKSSVMVLLGLGGERLAEEHVQETVKALNRMQPRYLSFLSLMFVPGTPLFEEAARGEFKRLGPVALLEQARDILAGLDMKRTVFRTDHASNYISLEGRLPKDKERLLRELEAGIKGDTDLRAEWARGL